MSRKSLTLQLLRMYSKHPKELSQQLNQLGTKFRMTQKVQDKVQTQRLLET